MRKRIVLAGFFVALLALSSAYAQTTSFFDLVTTGTAPEVQDAINKGADVHAQDMYGATPLMRAAAYNQNPAVVTTLLKARSSINAQDKDGMTPLMWAAKYNQNTAIMAALLLAGADVKARDKDGETPLMYAAWVNESPEVTLTLLKAGADIRARDKYGMTALILAASANENPGVITTLLKAGADIKTQDDNGLTALMQAARYNPNSEILATLLRSGADENGKSKEGKTAFDYARENEKLRGSDALKRLEGAAFMARIVRQGTEDDLQRAMQDPGGLDAKGKDLTGTLWLVAAAQNNADAGVVSLLLQAGANVNAKDESGLTALMAAASSNPNPEVASLLLKAGADIHAKNLSGDTALIFSGLNKNPQVATVLLKAGADVSAKDTNGKSALDFATSRDNTATYQQLVEATQPNWLGLHSMEIKGLSFDDIYPVFHTFYATHSLGRVTLDNTSGLPMTGIKVSFQIKEFMSDPMDCHASSVLGPGQSTSVDLFGLFLPTILQTTEKTETQARVDVEYAINGQLEHQSLVQSIPILNRNATSWNDNQRAAAFVTIRDPVVLAFAKNVNSIVKEKVQGDPSLLTAIAFFQALQLYGLAYSQDPIPTLTSSRQVADFIQFPRETLQYKGGKCSDFSVLYSALLESVGIETAFITIPGHIFLAFTTGTPPDEAKKSYSSRAGDLIFQGGKSWIPVEVTETAGFLQAWQDGAKEWRDGTARGQAAFYALHQAWQVYEPVALPGADVAVKLPASEQIVSATQREMSAFVDQEISAKVTELQSQIAGDQDPRKATNELGVLYARYGLYDQAQEEFAKLLSKEEYVPALLNMGNILSLSAQKEKALTYYSRAYAKDPGNPTVLLAVAKANYDLQNYSAAKKLYAELSANDPALARQFAYLDVKGEEATRANSAAATGVVWDQ